MSNVTPPPVPGVGNPAGARTFLRVAGVLGADARYVSDARFCDSCGTATA